MTDIEVEVAASNSVDAINHGTNVPLEPVAPGSSTGEQIPHTKTSTSLLEYKCLEENEIRLIKLLPGDWDDPLACELEHHHLMTCPAYVALSYAWGDMTSADPVIVNGQTHPIGNSLFSALRRLRSLASSSPDFAVSLDHTLDPIYVWADWLSLNQADEREKEVQIPRMGQIYGRAVRVIAWLGENDESEELGCKLLMDLATVEVPKCEYDDPWWDESYREALFKVMGDRKIDFVEILHSILIRPFFCRLWIIQEMSLPIESPIMLAGGTWIELNSLYILWHCALATRVINLTSSNFTTVHYHVDAFIRMRKLYHDCPSPFTDRSDAAAVSYRLNRYMRAVQGTFEASRKHDQIYGLLGIACARDLSPDLRPNYEAPFQDVYKTYTRVLLESCGDISILNRINHHIKGVPSWVPDYAIHPWNLTHGDWPGLKFLPGDKIQIRGVHLDTCSAFWCPSEKDFIVNNGLTPELTLLRELFEASSKAGGVPMNEMMDRWVDMCLTAIGCRDSPEAEGTRKVLHESVLAGKPIKQESWITGHVRYALDTSLFSTLRGSVDRVIRKDVRPEAGDVLCALEGSEYPVLLRPLAEDHYAFCGMCIRWEGDKIMKLSKSWFEGQEVQVFTIA